MNNITKPYIIATSENKQHNNSRKILYYCAHEILEYDDIDILTRAGYRVFSLGAYWNKSFPYYTFRQPKPQFFDDELLAAFHSTGCSWSVEKKIITPAFCALFDVVIVNHDLNWMAENFENFGSTKVIYRSFGQSTLSIEAYLNWKSDHYSIVRYSPREVGLPGFAKTDAVIYFGKDIDSYPKWTGGRSPITFHNTYEARDHACVPTIAQYAIMTEGMGARLYGYGNEGISNASGLVAPIDMAETYATAACYVYVWSRPPSYTLSLIEAMLIGLPVIAPSVKLAASIDTIPDVGWTPQRYEVDSFLSSGCGLVYDTFAEGRDMVAAAIAGGKDMRDISERSRERAQKMFDSSIIASQWKAFIDGLLNIGDH